MTELKNATDDKVLEVLYAAMDDLPSLMEDPTRWTTLVINLRRPHTYRAAIAYPYEGHQYRICLHRFDACEDAEAFVHPHPWPGAFWVLEGSYRMRVGRSPDRFSEPTHFDSMVLTPGSRYTITHPLVWHSVAPEETAWSMMVNGEPWDPKWIAHSKAPSTKGKDLQTMTGDQLAEHFKTFKRLRRNFN